ncbi:hypothetical protein BHM03_00022218 [Ensete ventricosum]|uniref:Trichome birefringence-like C-terminal domain-containing protein n=1 Tax=Ensete ventricosum TaxID=4639 RepID=A0A427AUU0_ENSVE|nr:hypothetical protein B296_00013790 [Ensete ventricosum]RZR93654.1 hypothetical protein BHM03_00022218 [Ensete ventricosum]
MNPMSLRRERERGRVVPSRRRLSEAELVSRGKGGGQRELSINRRVRSHVARLMAPPTPFGVTTSVTRYPVEWNGAASKNCFGETAPVGGWNYTAPYPDQTQVIKGVIKAMTSPAALLDITALSELRKDGHPSVYSGDLTPEQRANPDRSADCSHWCLPGLPDTWNLLLYTALFFA